MENATVLEPDLTPRVFPALEGEDSNSLADWGEVSLPERFYLKTDLFSHIVDHSLLSHNLSVSLTSKAGVGVSSEERVVIEDGVFEYRVMIEPASTRKEWAAWLVSGRTVELPNLESLYAEPKGIRLEKGIERQFQNAAEFNAVMDHLSVFTKNELVESVRLTSNESPDTGESGVAVWIRLVPASPAEEDAIWEQVEMLTHPVSNRIASDTATEVALVVV